MNSAGEAPHHPESIEDGASTCPGLEPRQRTIIACDIEGSTTRTNPGRAVLRDDMYELLESALLVCEVTDDLREPFYDRGDGAMILVRPTDRVPKTVLLNTFVPRLSEMLAEHAVVNRDRMFRLRIAMHCGDVHFDRRGAFGEDIDITFRLLNSQALKNRLLRTEAPLVLAVSDHIHDSVIRHGYAGIDDRDFELIIELKVAGQTRRGWVQVPAETVSIRGLSRVDSFPVLDSDTPTAELTAVKLR
jgi:class 3 adenylate cyclase